MVVFLAICGVLLVSLSVCAVVLRYQEKEIYRRNGLFMEALWKRRSKIPLLIEVLKRSGAAADQARQITDLRARLMGEVLAISDVLSMEKQLTDLLAKLFHANEADPKIKEEPLFFSLQKELEKALSDIRITLNDYNFSIEKWRMYCRMPWFKILEFLFQTRDFVPLQPM